MAGEKHNELLPGHGGYRNLKSFQIAQLVYDVTARFCDLYIDRWSRTRDQMVQAARSGVQNIAEGSMASGTSKKMELKLTNVARASLEELRLDYEDFLRQRELPLLEPEHPALVRFKKLRCRKLKDVQEWVADETARQRRENSKNGAGGPDTDRHGLSQTATDSPAPHPASVPVRVGPCKSINSSALAANAALSLINLASYLLNRQIQRLAADFEEQGGFTERLYRTRRKKRGY